MEELVIGKFCKNSYDKKNLFDCVQSMSTGKTQVFTYVFKLFFVYMQKRYCQNGARYAIIKKIKEGRKGFLDRWTKSTTGGQLNNTRRSGKPL